jgi:sugar transferase EpsL
VTAKRVFDVVMAAVGLLVMSPLFAVLAVAIRLSLGSPVFFRQTRPGLHGRPFTLYKFRSMTAAQDAAGNLRPDAERLTRFGRALRSSSLDELPELWNVLRGEMSLVGPRPLLMQYLELYDNFQARRHEVRPGITGWAQVNGRNRTTWEERFAMDVWYVENRSFALDLKILMLTMRRVITREGVAQEGRATMDNFTGSRGSRA